MKSRQAASILIVLVISVAPACAGGVGSSDGGGDYPVTSVAATTAGATLGEGSSGEAASAANTATEGASAQTSAPTGGTWTEPTSTSTSDEMLDTTGGSANTTTDSDVPPMRGDSSYCGDGTVDPGELCDDGNQIDDDTCTVACIPYYCGDGVVDPGYLEECDDGNLIGTDACTTGCKLAVCGDGYVQAGVEECDDLNSSNYDICLGDCTVAKCGDGFLWKSDLPQGQKTEQCDDGVNNGPCPASCSVTCENNFPDC